MSTIVLQSCVKTKLSYRAKAADLYTSPLFTLSRQYALSLNPDYTFILSAKYGLVDPEQEIDPYNLTLNTMGVADRHAWSRRVLTQLLEVVLPGDRVIFLAGMRYREFLIPALRKVGCTIEVPMKGLSLFKQLQWLKAQGAKEMSEVCKLLHACFNERPQFRFPFDDTQIPLNGIYVLFEKGEYAHNYDRIVRIGTHTGASNLRKRLQEHFLNENKDRSIFRKHVGRALLARAGDPFLEQWEWNLTSRAAKDRYSHLLDHEKQQAIEAQVSAYIQEYFTFAVFRVDDKTTRLGIEKALIGTISLCHTCQPSPHWLGLHSPYAKIRESGLWHIQQLYKGTMSQDDFDSFKKYFLLKKRQQTLPLPGL